jgi:hypothetical protein
MMYLGFVMIGIGVIVVIAGLLQRSKMKKILAAPFKKTGEIASNPQAGDAKGTVSCEGAIATQQPIVAPCSNSQCVYYELKVEKQIEESKMTDKGMQTSKTWKNVSEQKQGSAFQVNDGSGPVGVDAREGIDADLKQSYSGAPPGGQGLGILANMLTGAIFGNERVLQYRATEKIIPAQGNLFVMGKLAGGQITKTDGMMGKLMLSTKGRDGLVGSVKTLSLILLIVGGLMGVGGIPIAIFGDKPKDVACSKSITDDQASAEGKAGDPCKSALKTDLDEYTWKVTKPGVWEVKVAQPADATVKALPRVYIIDSEGTDVGSYSDEGKASIGKVAASKGTYKIKIDANGAFDPAKLEGGFRYEMTFKFIKKGGADDDTKKAAKDDDKGGDEDKADDKGSDDDKPAPKKKGGKDDK